MFFGYLFLNLRAVTLRVGTIKNFYIFKGHKELDKNYKWCMKWTASSK
ncbi:MAG: hypothetical protein RLZZ419_1824 [Pseudomonadota bacterium]|jgi:uncharacterized protein involved in tellurium resistance